MFINAMLSRQIFMIDNLSNSSTRSVLVWFVGFI